MNVDLHELANKPGAGAAKKTLLKAGLWDEYHGLPVKEYRVKVEYEIREDVTDVVIVKARCKEEAADKASDQIENDCEYEIDFVSAEVLE